MVSFGSVLRKLLVCGPPAVYRLRIDVCIDVRVDVCIQTIDARNDTSADMHVDAARLHAACVHVTGEGGPSVIVPRSAVIVLRSAEEMVLQLYTS